MSSPGIGILREALGNGTSSQSRTAWGFLVRGFPASLWEPGWGIAGPPRLPLTCEEAHDE